MGLFRFYVRLFAVFGILMSIACMGDRVLLPPATPRPPIDAEMPSGSTYIPQKPVLPAPSLPPLPAKVPSYSMPPQFDARSDSTPKDVEGRGVVSLAKSNDNLAQDILNSEFPTTIVDRKGKEITFEHPPERIVVFDSAALEILFAIGEGDRVAGTHNFVSYPPEAQDVPKVGDAFNMDIEAVVGLEPDLVFLFYPDFEEELKNAGLRVLLIETVGDDFTKLSDQFRLWGRITGSVDEAERLASNFEYRIAEIEKILQPYGDGPSVFQDVGGLWTPGDNTLMGSVFRLLKLNNIAQDINGYGQISPEVIVDRNPQYIITPNKDNFVGNPMFNHLVAVRNNAVFTIGEEFLGISGPRFVLGVEEMAKKFYPGIFRVEP